MSELGIRNFEERCPDLVKLTRLHTVQGRSLLVGLVKPWENHVGQGDVRVWRC